MTREGYHRHLTKTWREAIQIAVYVSRRDGRRHVVRRVSVPAVLRDRGYGSHGWEIGPA